jgi:hypothetical protein
MKRSHHELETFLSHLLGYKNKKKMYGRKRPCRLRMLARIMRRARSSPQGFKCRLEWQQDADGRQSSMYLRISDATREGALIVKLGKAQ